MSTHSGGGFVWLVEHIHEVLKSTASHTMHIQGKWKMLKYGNQSTETKYTKQSTEVRRKVTYWCQVNY